ncbi:MAG TPA: hypothetical protein P5524_02595, partial [Candidatus Paceibacterota bacterium]|nr:hypothetical protein [Candidatus Paceibacterota bacterium]
MKNKKLFIFGIVAAAIALISSGMFVFPSSVKAATTWNVSVGSSGACTGIDPNCANIQDAITAASAGDTISVAAGTYTEDLVVDKLDLTLKSVSGTTTIQLVDGVGIDVQVGGFTLGGALGKGFTILPGAATTFLIQLANAPADVTISYNTMNTTGNATMGINVGAAGATGLTAIHNTFSAADVNDGAIWGPLLVDVNISDNTFTGPSALAAGGYAIQFSGVTGTSTIHGNHIANTATGIRISHGEGVSGLTVDGNIITGAVNAIRFEQYKASGGADGDMTTVIITNNVLSSNTTDLRIGDGANIKASQFAITQNSFGSTAGTGLNNQHATEVVDAVSNWWGNATGPYNLTTNPAGTGSDVSDNVVYNPWNNTSATTTQTYHVSVAEPTYTTIQGAITAASAGDTVLVTADTYTEDLTVNKADIKLESISGAATTIIQLVTGAGIDLQAGATGFTIGGAASKGFTILPGAATTRLIQLENAPADVTISYNVMNTTGNATMGINVGAAGATSLTVSNNIFSAADVGDGAIWGPLLVNVNISDNTFVGPGALAANGYAIQFSGVTGTSVIHGNDISNTSQGIVIAHGEGVSGLTIDGNTIAGAVNGLRFAQYKASGGADGDMTTVTVSNNTLSGNTIDLRIGDGANIIA